MIRFHFVLIILLVYSFGYGQQNNGLVKYEIWLVENKLIEDEIKQNVRLPMILEKLTFSLAFTNSRAAFNLDENRQIDQRDLQEVSPFFVGVSTDKYFWQDKDAAYHTMNAAPFMDGNYLLVDSFENGWHTGWEITGESKEIAGYKCFKATRYNLSWDLKGEERRFPVTAWFCPELPFSFGPLKYGGLPGLILELQTHLTVFGAKSIVLRNDIKIPEMPTFEEISEKSYYKKFDDKMREIRKRRQKQ
ncbi:GLPGLI family protein [Parapedobacter sp. DT-150]|uniref:GLPGLI family protein n=1 Tax=Parapedobacter sp. DT-150 TaxID=3396162 RepID=UPI003F1DC78C